MGGMVKSISKTLFGMNDARRQTLASDDAANQQMANERRRLDKETSEVKKREALLKRGGAGRSLLIKTSPTGVPGGGHGAGAGNLGGS